MIRIKRCSCGIVRNQSARDRSIDSAELLTSIVENELRRNQKKLESAVKETLSEPSRRAIRKIREKGYDVVFVLEGTTSMESTGKSRPKRRKVPDIQFELTAHDKEFLRALKICSD